MAGAAIRCGVRCQPLQRRWRPCVLLLGPLPSRLGTARVLTVCLACGIVIIAAVALGRLPYLILLVAIFTMGICVVGGQLGANGLSAAEISGPHPDDWYRLGARHWPAGRHCRLWSRWLPARPGLAATAHPAVRLPDCRRRRDLRCAAATARGARGGRTDPAPGMMRAPSALSPPGYLAALPITTAAWTTQCGPYAAATTVMPVTCSNRSWHTVVRPARARSPG